MAKRRTCSLPSTPRASCLRYRCRASPAGTRPMPTPRTTPTRRFSARCAESARRCRQLAAGDPGLGQLQFVEQADISRHEHAVDPHAPCNPLVTGEDGDAAEIVLVLARKFQFLPGHVAAVEEHVAQVEQHVDRALELDAVVNRLLEFAVVVQRELAHHGDGNLVVLDVQGDHGCAPREYASTIANRSAPAPRRAPPIRPPPPPPPCRSRPASAAARRTAARRTGQKTRPWCKRANRPSACGRDGRRASEPVAPPWR